MSDYDQALIKMQQDALDQQEDVLATQEGRNRELAIENLRLARNNRLHCDEIRALARELAKAEVGL